MAAQDPNVQKSGWWRHLRNLNRDLSVPIRTENDHQKRLTIDYFPQYSIRNNE
jgi:hypothetical protein